MVEKGGWHLDVPMTVRSYEPGDEGPILWLFQEVFRVHRSLEHWRWKFQENPWGRERISTSWIDGELAGHYAGYPVPFLFDGREEVVYQVGDTMTNPRFRHVGRRRTSVLARTADHFYRHFCQGQIPFFYGFNTGKIHKYGRIFLRYEPVATVMSWHAEVGDPLPPSRLTAWLKGYRIERVSRFPEEIDQFFQRVAHRYGNLVARRACYLNWRYCDCPDQDYLSFLLRARGRCAGFWVFKRQGDSLLLGDALFEGPEAACWSLRAVVHGLAMGGEHVRSIVGWFGERPSWWVDFLRSFGFTAEPEENGLKMVVIRFGEAIDPNTFGDSLYYTWGDSDLF